MTFATRLQTAFIVTVLALGLLASTAFAEERLPYNLIGNLTLQKLLPADVPGGYKQTAIHSMTTGMPPGHARAIASAKYMAGEKIIYLSITDVGHPQRMADFADKFDGQPTYETFDPSTGDGTYGAIATNRMFVSAEGHGATPEELKDAVEQTLPAVENLPL